MLRTCGPLSGLLRLLVKVVVGTVFVVTEGDSSAAATASAGLKAEPSRVGLKADGAS